MILKKIPLFLLITLLLHRFCQVQTDGFSLGKVQSNLPFHPEWETTCVKSYLDALNQPFYYLGKGAQTFAFVSEDEKYVLKFYRHHRVGHPFSKISWLLPSSLRRRLKQTIAKRENKRLKDFSSYLLANSMLQKETGLVQLHLNKTKEPMPTTLHDKIGVMHKVDLKEMEFILQKKADFFYPTLEKWIAAKEFDKAKGALSNLISILHNRCKKELFDKDPDLATNFGFIGEEPIQFDVGRFKVDPSRSDPEIYGDELIRITDRLCVWLDTKAPELSTHIREEIHTFR